MADNPPESHDQPAPLRLDVSAIPPLGTVFFEAEIGGAKVSAFVIRTVSGLLRCYANACPHVAVYGLDFGDGDVVDKRDGRIVCSNHGARFTPEDGLCVFGPCRGQSLRRWPCTEEDGVATIHPQATPPGWPGPRP